MRISTSKQHKCVRGPLRECRSIQLGASGLPYYCTPLVCISVVIGLLAVWRHNKPKTKNQKRHSKARDTRGWRMTMCSLCMRQLGWLSNTQRTVCVCVCVCVSLCLCYLDFLYDFPVCPHSHTRWSRVPRSHRQLRCVLSCELQTYL